LIKITWEFRLCNEDLSRSGDSGLIILEKDKI